MLSKYTDESTKEMLKPIFSLTGALILTNIFLALFNLIPVPPLDGFTVLDSSIPRSLSHITQLIQQYSNMIILFVFFFGGELLVPLVSSLCTLLIKGSVAIFSLF